MQCESPLEDGQIGVGNAWSGEVYSIVAFIQPIGQRTETLRQRKGMGRDVARESTVTYSGQMMASDSMLVGARMGVVFGQQHPTQKEE